MVEELEEKVKKLSPEDRATFEILESLPREKVLVMNREIIARAEDRHWCEERRIDYVNADILQIAIYTYRELAADGKI
ncbi:Uncharacterised protein [uncultured archaeon]|nr:Uncharacterised protein [uncultured archaeon]